ncbi:subtilisin-like protease Pr1A [Lophiotrema nucula]|uniref:Subtilisin-like protease Pr1A n=1 Tax=Lophiotrema nucula TaxID=690887 RepID=A0A6A5YU96_9PLEO|nr:subtilisin-like protease Pr1A [Lophiotrema nucula]
MVKFLAISFLLCAGAHATATILGAETETAVPGSYVVVLKKDVTTAALNLHLTSALSKSAQASAFNFAGLKGYTIKASKDTITSLAESDDATDQTFTLPPSSPSSLSARNTQANAPWGLARISHRKKGATDYVFTPTIGTYVYVLDSGIRTSHQLFQGRATFGFNAVGGSSNGDVNGHGTHVAGIASSQTYGVVRFAGIVSVKVLDDTGSSTTSQIISGINWTVQDIQTRGRLQKATALLTIGGGFSAALNNAVAAASNAGVMFAVAAGNENTGSSNSSPGSEPTACTVGGTTIDDARMSTSNYGPGIDIFAPGQLIPSLWYTSDTAVQTLSGTSMAAAHVAGLGAYFLAIEGPRGAVALCDRMREVATKNALSGIPSGTANLLAYNLSGL